MRACMKKTLGAIAYQPNDVVLHCDTRNATFQKMLVKLGLHGTFGTGIPTVGPDLLDEFPPANSQE